MSATARFAILIGLTNLPENEDWEVLDRLYKVLSPNLTNVAKRKLKRLLGKREPYVIPELLSLLSLDETEYLHLMGCIAKNGVENDRSRIANNEEIYETAEYWKLE